MDVARDSISREVSSENAERTVTDGDHTQHPAELQLLGDDLELLDDVIRQRTRAVVATSFSSPKGGSQLPVLRLSTFSGAASAPNSPMSSHSSALSPTSRLSKPPPRIPTAPSTPTAPGRISASKVFQFPPSKSAPTSSSSSSSSSSSRPFVLPSSRLPLAFAHSHHVEGVGGRPSQSLLSHARAFPPLTNSPANSPANSPSKTSTTRGRSNNSASNYMNNNGNSSGGSSSGSSNGRGYTAPFSYVDRASVSELDHEDKHKAVDSELLDPLIPPYDPTLMIHQGTVGELLNHFTDLSTNRVTVNTWFRRVFLLNLRMYTSPSDVVTRLVTCYNTCKPIDKPRVVRIVRDWARRFYEDDIRDAYLDGHLDVFLGTSTCTATETTITIATLTSATTTTTSTSTSTTTTSTTSTGSTSTEPTTSTATTTSGAVNGTVPPDDRPRALRKAQESLKEALEEAEELYPVNIRKHARTSAFMHRVSVVMRDDKLQKIPSMVDKMTLMEIRYDTASNFNGRLKQKILRPKPGTTPGQSPPLGPLDFTSFPPSLVSEWFLIYDSRMLVKIKPREFCKKNWTRKETASIDSPNILMMVEAFNRRTYWAATEVLRRKQLGERVVVLKALIDIAFTCKVFKNFFAAMAILNGISLTPVQRLKASWKKLPSPTIKRFEMLSEDLSANRNYSKYRELYTRAFTSSSSPSNPHIPSSPTSAASSLPGPGSLTNKFSSSFLSSSPSQKSLYGSPSSPPTHLSSKSVQLTNSVLSFSLSSSSRDLLGHGDRDGHDHNHKSHDPEAGVTPHRWSKRLVIPYLPVLLKDLFQLEEVPNLSEKDKTAVNFHKFAKQYKELVGVFIGQAAIRRDLANGLALDKPLKRAVQEWMAMAFDEEEMWEYSYSYEPKAAPTHK